MSDAGRAIVALIVIAAVAGVIVRPRRTPEAAWAAGGAALLVAAGLLPIPDAVAGLAKSLDVCLFLAGMKLLAETARREGLFDAVAAFAVNRAPEARRPASSPSPTRPASSSPCSCRTTPPPWC